MIKSDLVKKVTRKAKNISKKDMKIIIDTIFDTMAEALAAEDKIEIRGFGSFKIKKRAGRAGRNPKNGKIVKVPPKKVPFFKVGKDLRERVNC